MKPTETLFDEPKLFTVSLDIKPRKLSSKVIEQQQVKFNQLSASMHSAKLEHARLQAENQALKQNIQSCREILFETRAQEKPRTGSKLTAMTVFMLAIISVAVHYEFSGPGPTTPSRKLMSMSLPTDSSIVLCLVVALWACGTYRILRTLY